MLGFWHFEFFCRPTRQKCRTASPCHISWRSVKPLSRYDIFSIFQDGGYPPSWICDACGGTTHEVNKVVCFFDVRYVLSDISDDECSASTVQRYTSEDYQQFLHPVYIVCVLVGCWRHMCCQFAPVDCISRLSGFVELALRYRPYHQTCVVDIGGTSATAVE